MELNKGQEKVFQQLQEFLASDERFFSLESGGGYGKTFLLNHLESKIPELNKVRSLMHLPQIGKMLYTATTNKAASLLGNNSSTIHKLFKIYPNTNYKTGVTTYKVGNTPDLYEELLVLDESSMLDPKIFEIVESKIRGRAKVIFALDPYQLAPIGHEAPIVNELVTTQNIPRGELTEPMRQDKASHLFKVCNMLRDCVRKQVYTPIELGKGIRAVSAPEFQAEYLAAFQAHEDVRIIALSNNQVESHNGYIRKTLYNIDRFQLGDPVVAASAMDNVPEIKVEETYTIHEIGKTLNDGHLDYYEVDLGLSQWFKVPVNKQSYFKRLKAAQQEGKSSGDWSVYYTLKANYLDIRDGFACTAHKAQGSTYDKVFLDFASLTQCPDINTFLRALYVAVSRARYEVVIYGL